MGKRAAALTVSTPQYRACLLYAVSSLRAARGALTHSPRLAVRLAFGLSEEVTHFALRRSVDFVLPCRALRWSVRRRAFERVVPVCPIFALVAHSVGDHSPCCIATRLFLWNMQHARCDMSIRNAT